MSKKSNSRPRTEASVAAATGSGAKRLTGQQLGIIITAAVLLVAIILSFVFLIIVPAYKKDKNFDYMKSDLSKYITLTEEQYKSISLNLNIAEPKDIDVDIAIIGMLAMDKAEDASYSGVYKNDVALTPGDMVNVYYRGYVMEDGKQKTVISNLSSNYNEVEIGGGQFPAMGFELGLVGVVPKDCAQFVKITTGEVREDQVIYLTYERKKKDSDEKTKTGTSIRIDLTDTEDVARLYGTEFKDRILGQSVGATLSFSTTIDGATYEYTNTKVDYVTECERDENILKLECYFPYNSGVETLNNKTVYFDVFVKNAKIYEVPQWNDEYITRKIAEVDSGLRMDQLMEYEGESLTEKYEDYVEKYLREQYEIKKKELVIDELWNKYANAVKVKRLPGIKVDEIYSEYYNQVKSEYESSGGVIYNEMTEETEQCEDLASYAKIYLGLWYSEENWTEVVRDLAEDLVTERIILYYIMKEEGLTPTEAELADKVAEIKREYMDEYIYQYLLDYDENREELVESNIDKNKTYVEKMDKIVAAWKANDTEAEVYKTFVSEREAEMFEYYDEDYFVETAYYEIVVDAMVTWPEVTTMDAPAIK